MSKYSVVASTSGFAQTPSDRGSKGWTASSPQYINASIGPNGGTNWAIWSVLVPAANPNETLDSITLNDGHDYTVAGGAGTRIVTVGVGFGRTVASFTGSGAATAIGSRIGSGVGANVHANVQVPSGAFSSNDLRSGSFLVGIYALTDGSDPSWLSDVYRMGILSWDIYTQGTTVTPPTGTPSGHLDAPAGNSRPGVAAGGQFASTRAWWDANGLPIQSFLTFFWTIEGAGITFAANGTQALRVDRGLNAIGGSVENWNWADSGALNIAAGTPPGNYTLLCHISDNIAAPDPYLTTQLTVPYPAQYITTEF